MYRKGLNYWRWNFYISSWLKQQGFQIQSPSYKWFSHLDFVQVLQFHTQVLGCEAVIDFSWAEAQHPPPRRHSRALLRGSQALASSQACKSSGCVYLSVRSWKANNSSCSIFTKENKILTPLAPHHTVYSSTLVSLLSALGLGPLLQRVCIVSKKMEAQPLLVLHQETSLTAN